MDLEELRRRKLLEYQEKLKKQAELEKQRQEAELAKEAILRKVLTPEAKSRLSNVRLANPELAEKVIAMLIYLYQSGRLTRKVTDEDLKKILLKLSQTKREPRIKIKRK